MILVLTILLNIFMLDQWSIPLGNYQATYYPQVEPWFNPAMLIVGILHLVVSVMNVASKSILSHQIST